jgi:hypothetical protein
MQPITVNSIRGLDHVDRYKLESLITAGTHISGTAPITPGATSLAVTFAAPFASAPSVQISIARSTGAPLLQANVGTITVSGFSVDFSAPAPAGYSVEWVAGVPA